MPRGSQEFPGLSPAEDTPLDLEGEKFNISDGMEPVKVPPRMSGKEFLALFGGNLPEGVSPEILGDDVTLELER